MRVPHLKRWSWPGCLQGFCRICSSMDGHISWNVVGYFHKFREESYCIWCISPPSINVIAGVESIIMDCKSKVPSIYWVGSVGESLMRFLLIFTLHPNGTNGVCSKLWILSSCSLADSSGFSRDYRNMFSDMVTWVMSQSHKYKVEIGYAVYRA